MTKTNEKSQLQIMSYLFVISLEMYCSVEQNLLLLNTNKLLKEKVCVK